MSTRRYLQLVLVLGTLTAIGPLTIDMYLPALPSLTADLATTESAAQATITGMLVGLGVGQLVIGPLSDAVGRRRPLIIGVAGHLLASVLCALAPSIALLTVARLLQGLAAAAIAVVSMAVVRDLFSGMAAATLLSRLMLVTGDMDDNVHPGNTLRLANALIRANKRFDFFMFPGQRHGYGDMSDYWFWLRADYFCKNLLGDSAAGIDMVELNKEKEQVGEKKARPAEEEEPQ